MQHGNVSFIQTFVKHNNIPDNQTFHSFCPFAFMAFCLPYDKPGINYMTHSGVCCVYKYYVLVQLQLFYVITLIARLFENLLSFAQPKNNTQTIHWKGNKRINENINQESAKKCNVFVTYF